MAHRDPIYLPVWPYFLLGGLVLGAAVWIMIAWLPPWRPDAEDLVKLEGKIERTQVRDHISDTTAGSVWPMLTSVYFTLEGLETEVRYPYTHAEYGMVRHNTSGYLEVWVDKADIGSGAPLLIWQLKETSPHTDLYPNTDISFATIAAQIDKVGQSRRALLVKLVFAGLGLVVLGYVMRWSNRRRGAVRHR